MAELTEEQRRLLNDITNDKFAAGPFAGMVFNEVRATKRSNPALLSQFPTIQEAEQSIIDAAISDALNVRLRMKKLVE